MAMIDYAQTLPDEIVDLRHRVLRNGLPRETAIFEGDFEPDAAHFAGTAGGEIVGCATIIRRDLDGQAAWQLRGMAVSPELRQQGVGGRLLECVVSHIRQSGPIRLLWCNARESAVVFYKKHGFEIISGRFEIPTAGPHFRMMRQL